MITPEASAFCGFYVSGSSEQLTNRATRVALMRSGQRTVLTMSNDYQGPPQNFAMVVPVPIVLQQENVRTLPHDVFAHIEALTAPRLVEYWEQDPCRPEPSDEDSFRTVLTRSSSRRVESLGGAGLGVTIEARFAVGEYDILVLSARESSGLETWLRQNRYNIPRGASAALAPYIRDGMKFFVARVDVARVQRRPDGAVRLSPLRFHYDSQDFRLPVRLGLLNAPEKQDLIVYVLHPTSRFELANYPNVFIPTNLDVTDNVRENFGGFYSSLFDRTLARFNHRAVVTEYAWSTSSCDPCPTPPLSPADLATLGADVLTPGVSSGPSRGRSGRPQWGGSQAMTVTRLHTRYDASTLSEDLVFREAGAVMGGREAMINGTTREIEMGARPAGGSGSNFQGRYAIRHPWTGPMRCQQPVRGIWGGPPSQAAPRASVATDLAERRGPALDLAQHVVTEVAELGIRGRRPGLGPAPQRARTRATPRVPLRVSPKVGRSLAKTPVILGASLMTLLAALSFGLLSRRRDR